ncbi:hypothetical protein EDC44_101150 [Cricetibacter osteomyelitidis]|uniref:Uncharacterized protein n=1 Tax=Cricetibacter osteomyelitidis TaxID=1521931 RepID=A0A4R2T449_9PAST|nr:hypothetical protein [Cricetibacter osteomyelitidis]TCP97767.1 hypothetical protein EDC44_101150 [Cricetibacter osteomyelitidis]
MTKKYRTLRFSIRKCSDDEIEIRHSMYDGYIRGFIRALFIGILIVGSFMDLKHGVLPFQYMAEDIQRDLDALFEPDKYIRPNYQRYLKLYQDPEFIKEYPNEKLESYEEYRKPYIERAKGQRMWAYFHFIWPLFLLFLLCLPRARGLRINRKKRVIYRKALDNYYSVAFVPKNGDPLMGLNYSLFGEYAFGSGHFFSLGIRFKDFETQRVSGASFGVYPTPNAEHNAEIIRAIRAYLTEDEPAFLNHIGSRYKVWGGDLGIIFCNAFTWGIPFRRKKAEQAVDNALKKWKRQTIDKKTMWFNEIHQNQEHINQVIELQGKNNVVE